MERVAALARHILAAVPAASVPPSQGTPAQEQDHDVTGRSWGPRSDVLTDDKDAAVARVIAPLETTTAPPNTALLEGGLTMNTTTDAPTTAVVTAGSTRESPLKSIARYLVHSWRCGGYAPWMLLLLVKYPVKTLLGIALREMLRRNVPASSTLAHQLISYGSSLEPKFVRRQQESYDPAKQYMITLHPHGVLVCGWFNLLGRDCPDFHQKLHLMDDLKVMLCLAPAVNLMPLHGEMYRNRVTDASASTLRRILQKTDMSPAICPGGFSEAIYTNADPVKEYCFIEGRLGFLKQAIENKVDIIPTYTFGANDMYKTWDWNRHKRAVLAQKLSLPVFMWWGKYGSNMPYTEKLTTATFDPFPSSQYTLDQLDQCHADYKAYLQKCYNSYKHEAGYGHRELEFIGRKKLPEKYDRGHAKL